jgi:nucleotide-binding universal stress UspA family protein
MLDSMEGIVVGVDESSRAEAALRWGVRHAALVDQPVTAVMAWGYVDQHHLEPDAPLDPAYDADLAAKVLDELVVRACGANPPVAAVAVNDLPARALLDAADGASLLAIGARRISAVRGLWRDSVSRQVLRNARCPVAVVGDSADRDGLPIVVGIDGSAPARRALNWAIDLAQTTGRRLVAVHAWHLPATSHSFYAPYPSRTALADEAEQILQRELDQVDTSGLVAPVEHLLLPASPTEALLEASATASIVAVGSRGQGAIARAVLGSVSDRVSHRASAPVVVVP